MSKGQAIKNPCIFLQYDDCRARTFYAINRKVRHPGHGDKDYEVAPRLYGLSRLKWTKWRTSSSSSSTRATLV